MKVEPFNHEDYDYYPPGEPLEFPAPRNSHAAPAHKARFELIPFDKIRLDTAPAYLVKGIIPRVGLCVFWGPPKCGKSFLVFDIVMHVSLGWEYRGRKVCQGSVVYCALEGCSAFKNRIPASAAARQRKRCSFTSYGDINDASGRSCGLDCLYPRHARNRKTGRNCHRHFKPLPLTGSESNDRDMAAYVKAADVIRDAFNCAVIIVHHCGHEGTRPRGQSSLMGALDAQIAVKRDVSDNIIATVELMKDGTQGDEFTSRLEIVEVGIDDDGDMITSCVISPVDSLTPSTTKKESAPKLTKAAKIALASLHEAIEECGEIPPASNHIPAGVKCVTQDQWQDYAGRRGISNGDTKDSLRKAFSRASAALIADRLAGCWAPYVWPIK